MELVEGGLGNRVVIKALYWSLKLSTSLVVLSLLYCRLGIVRSVFSFIYFRAVKTSFPCAFSRKLFQQLVFASLIAWKY